MKASALIVLFLFALSTSAELIDAFNADEEVNANALTIRVTAISVQDPPADFIGGVRELTARVRTMDGADQNPTELVECAVSGGRFFASSDPTAANTPTQSGCLIGYSGLPFNDFFRNPFPTAINFVGDSGCDAWLLNIFSATPAGINVDVVYNAGLFRDEIDLPRIDPDPMLGANSAFDVVIPFGGIGPGAVTNLGIELNTFGGQNMVLNHFCCSSIVLCEHEIEFPDDPVVGNSGTASITCTNTGTVSQTFSWEIFLDQTIFGLVSGNCSDANFDVTSTANSYRSSVGALDPDAAVTCNLDLELIGTGFVPEQQFTITNAGSGFTYPSTDEEDTRNTIERCNNPEASDEFTVEAAPTTLPPTTAAPTTEPPTLPPSTAPPTTGAPTTEAPTDPPTTQAPVDIPTSAPPTTGAPTTDAPTLAPTVTPTASPTVPPDNLCTAQKANFFDPCAVCACDRCNFQRSGCTIINGDSMIDPTIGNNCLTITSGFTYQGDLLGTPGDDCIFIEGQVTLNGQISLLEGNDCLMIGPLSVVTGEVDFGNGRDCMAAEGAEFREGVFGGLDGDKLTAIDSFGTLIDGESGGDCVEVLGTGTAKKRGEKRQIGAFSEFSEGVSGGPGIDCLRVENSVVGSAVSPAGAISGGTENDCIVAFNSRFNSVNGDEGADLIQVANFEPFGDATAAAVFGGLGPDCMVVSGHISSSGFVGLIDAGDVNEINTCDTDNTINPAGCTSNFPGACPR